MYYILKTSRKLKNKYFLLSLFFFSILHSPVLSRPYEIHNQEENINPLSRCDLIPKIESAIVYQSVEAPQIEPQHLIENTEDLYEDYDLVHGKPAAVLIKLKLSEQFEELYSIGLQINGNKINTSCSKNLEQRDIEKNNLKLTLEPRRCELKEGEFIRLQRRVARKNIKNLYHFIELPTQDEISSIVEEQEISVSIEDQNRNICSSKSFSVFMRKNGKLYLDFISLEYDNNEQNKLCK